MVLIFRCRILEKGFFGDILVMLWFILMMIEVKGSGIIIGIDFFIIIFLNWVFIGKRF